MASLMGYLTRCWLGVDSELEHLTTSSGSLWDSSIEMKRVNYMWA